MLHPILEPEMSFTRNSYALEDTQLELRDVFRDFFGKQCPAERVRAVEATGFDDELWRELIGLDVMSMGLAESVGGAGACLVDLVIVGEQCGRVLAPVPFADAVSTARLLSRCRSEAAGSWLAAAVAGDKVVVQAGDGADGAVLVAAGAVADGVVTCHDDGLVLVQRASQVDAVRPRANQASLPMAVWDLAALRAARCFALLGPDGDEAGRLVAEAQRERRLLTAATLVGLAAGALEIGVAFASEREAFGVPIGTFQAISHSLVDAAIAVEGARHMLWKTAWICDHDPQEAQLWVLMLSRQAAQAAILAATTSLHVHGGAGVVMESDIQLFFRRATGWATLCGDPVADLREIAARVLTAMGRP